MTSKTQKLTQTATETPAETKEVDFSFDGDDTAEGKDMLDWYKDMQQKGGPQEAHTPEWDNPISGDPGMGDQEGLLGHELAHTIQDGGDIG